MLDERLLHSQGSLSFFCGPMFCGKTLELVRQLQIYREQRIPLVCVRPSLDTRSSTIQSRSGLLHDAITVDANDMEALRNLFDSADVIGLDEAQLFPVAIMDMLIAELKRGKTILAAGLDTDFRGVVFPTSLALLSFPETVIHRSRAVCAVCRQYNATRTQRLRNGRPVPASDPQVLIEGSQTEITYEARCLKHHAVV